MEPTKELIQQLARDDIQQAKRMTLSQRFWAGAELFDDACAVSKSGIRWQHPTYDEIRVLEELRRRVNLGSRMRERE